MPHVQGLGVLDDRVENQKLLLKLPDWTTSGWNCCITKALDEEKAYPGFCEYADFISKEAHIAYNPVSSLFVLKHTNENPEKEQKHLKASVLPTLTKVNKGPKATTKATGTLQDVKGFKTSHSTTQKANRMDFLSTAALYL